ncbi:hypothetical protein D3C78_190770 [compost metagenome]
MKKLFAFFWLVISGYALAADDSSSDGWLLGVAKDILAYVTGIFTAIKDAVEWLGKVFVEAFKALWNLITDALVWVIESLLALGAKLLNGIADSFDLGTMTSTMQGYWNMVPPEVMQVMQAIGVPSALAIVVSGILIRFAMQLIPFIRLGS